ncbi:pre-mRNA-splicing factor SPF27-like isoform X1 [Ostrea edulis]|uniref:pre-mRNA-splicing factor SPF27-like isoform X1 n=1 Tax=Ostrea edulis TaxID=37623 RepID=UPI0024AF2B32|nr:pre-mRNA-splicing factor SPF27-like isoform X1 [Ostrea edulis]
MAGEVVVDALPYFDRGYDEPGVREAALSLVEEETRRYRPTKNYLEYLPAPNYNAFETEIMKNENERMLARLPMEMLSMKRYELPQPSAGKMTDISAWTECVDNSQAQLEHQALRILNLELMADNGSNAWKQYNSILVQMMENAQKHLQDLRKHIQEINWRRKSEQTEAGNKLKELEDSWVGLVSKNYEIERACVELEKEVTILDQKKAKVKMVL